MYESEKKISKFIYGIVDIVDNFDCDENPRGSARSRSNAPNIAILFSTFPWNIFPAITQLQFYLISYNLLLQFS